VESLRPILQIDILQQDLDNLIGSALRSEARVDAQERLITHLVDCEHLTGRHFSEICTNRQAGGADTELDCLILTQHLTLAPQTNQLEAPTLYRFLSTMPPTMYTSSSDNVVNSSSESAER